MPSLSPIEVELLRNGLTSICDEMFLAIMKSAYSTNIKERHDHSAAIFDADGRVVVQGESLPLHLASMLGLVEVVLDRYGKENISPGDMFLSNDPFVGRGSHLPDVAILAPVFREDELVMFVSNIAHHSDIGGMAPGSMAGGMTEIYQEGLRIPVIRLFHKHELQDDILDLILLNVRVPDERRGDYFAQIAACRLGVTRIKEIIKQYGVPAIKSCFDEIISRTSHRMNKVIRDLPDGIYKFEDIMDDDGMGTFEIPISIKITVNGSKICFDFTGTSDQVRGNINVTRNATQASVCYALKALLDPDAPNNQGMLDLPEIIIERGSLLDANFPAPVAARANTCQRIIDVIIGALSKAKPEAAVAAANGANTTAVFSGIDPKSGESYVYLETLGGGFGGRAKKDGKDGVQVHITNTSNLPVESIEMEYPLIVHSYKLINSSGGAGRYRGGLGLERIIQPINHSCIFNGAGERFSHKPWGIFGGSQGSSGEFLKRDCNGNRERLPNKPISVNISEKEAVIIRTPGAGGYGRAEERSKEDLTEDANSDKFSNEFLNQNYPQWSLN